VSKYRQAFLISIARVALTPPASPSAERTPPSVLKLEARA
jgi:hypothetical protein